MEPMTEIPQDDDLPRLEERAEAGDAEAQCELASLLEMEEGEDGEPALAGGHDALYWYLQAAQQGVAAAQYGLFCMLEDRGISEADGRDAVSWCLQAANGGHADAQFQLACMLESGTTMETEAGGHGFRFWLLKAAQQGNCEALQALAESCSDEELLQLGGRELLELCRQWQRVSRLQGAALFSSFPGMRQEPNMNFPFSGEEPMDADDELLEQADDAASAGDYDRAMLLLQRAGERGDAEALATLGRWYAEGRGCMRDVSRAVSYYKRAAEAGSEQARYELGCLYLGGDGIAPDFDRAAEWLAPLAGKGYMDAGLLLEKACRHEVPEPQQVRSSIDRQLAISVVAIILALAVAFAVLYFMVAGD